MSAYDTAPVVPMTAPVTRFSLRMPVVPVIIIASDAREMDTVIARRNPIITMLLLRVKLLYSFCIILGWW